MGDLLFPGMVMILKLVTKLFVGRSASSFDFMKAMVVFPIDITFLALSFGAAILYATPPDQIRVGSIRLMFLFFGSCVILAVVTTALCQKSDKALDNVEPWPTIGYSVVTYGVSLAALIASLNVQGLIR